MTTYVCVGLSEVFIIINDWWLLKWGYHMDFSRIILGCISNNTMLVVWKTEYTHKMVAFFVLMGDMGHMMTRFLGTRLYDHFWLCLQRRLYKHASQKTLHNPLPCSHSTPLINHCGCRGWNHIWLGPFAAQVLTRYSSLTKVVPKKQIHLIFSTYSSYQMVYLSSIVLFLSYPSCIPNCPVYIYIYIYTHPRL